MAQSQTILGTGRGVSGGAFFSDGMQSSTDPLFISDRAFRSAMNVDVRGGAPKTRPGYRCVFTLPEGRLQGLTVFTPTGSGPHLVAAVEGLVYVSQYPFTSYRQLPGIQFWRGSKHVYWASGRKSARRNPDGTITVIPTRNVLVMQDGRTRAAFWDGGESRHLDPTTLETPVGDVMFFTGDRLWVHRDSQVYASDISDPLSFSETTYLAEGLPFSIPGSATAMAETPSVDAPQLVVFTNDTATLFQSNIRTRDRWKDTDNFQRALYQDIGCVGPRAVASQYGFLWWFSNRGLVSLNAAEAARVSSELPYRDLDMAVSKAFMSPNLDDVALGSFDNFLLCSVPSGSLENRHTWVLDQGPQTRLSDKVSPAWAGVWTGTQPVQWATANIVGVDRVFHASVDRDGQNRVWEAFTADRLDNGNPITSYVETKAHFQFSADAGGLDYKEFRFAELTFSDILGDLDVAVYWAGTRGQYKRLSTYRFVATEGSIRHDQTIDLTTELLGYSGQSRRFRTPAISPENVPGSSCGVESPDLDAVDTAFSLLVVWSGRATLRSYRIFADPAEETATGECIEDETGTKIVPQGLAEVSS